MGNLVVSIPMMQRKKKRRHRSFKSSRIFHKNDTEVEKTVVLKPTEQCGLPIKNLPRYEDHVQVRNETDVSRAVVLTRATTIHQLNNCNVHLPLGTVLNVKFQQHNLFYVQTAHGIHGYVNCNICAPFEMSISSEDTSDLGNDNDFDNIELNQHNASIMHQTANFNEHDIDVLYLKAIYNHKRRKKYKIIDESVAQKSTILQMNNNYEGTKENTLTVERGEKVLMVHNNVNGWFWVRNERDEEGFIPAAIISYVLE